MVQEELNGKVFYGGPIITVNENQPIIEAVGIKDEKIMAIGTLEDVKAKMRTNFDMINLKGNCLLPGFIESHMHLIHLMSSLVNVDLSSVESLMELQNILIDAAAKKTPDELIYGFSYYEI